MCLPQVGVCEVPVLIRIKKFTTTRYLVVLVGGYNLPFNHGIIASQLLAAEIMLHTKKLSGQWLFSLIK